MATKDPAPRSSASKSPSGASESTAGASKSTAGASKSTAGASKSTPSVSKSTPSVSKSTSSASRSRESTEPTQPTRNAAQLEADVTAARHRIANAVESLVDEVHPNRIKQRQVEKVRTFVDTEVETAKSLLFNARGDLRKDRVILIGAAAVGAIAFLVIVRSLTGRSRDA